MPTYNIYLVGMFSVEDLRHFYQLLSHIATLKRETISKIQVARPGFNSGPFPRKLRALQLEHHRSYNTFKFTEFK